MSRWNWVASPRDYYFEAAELGPFKLYLCNSGVHETRVNALVYFGGHLIASKCGEDAADAKREAECYADMLCNSVVSSWGGQ